MNRYIQLSDSLRTIINMAYVTHIDTNIITVACGKEEHKEVEIIIYINNDLSPRKFIRCESLDKFDYYYDRILHFLVDGKSRGLYISSIEKQWQEKQKDK